jgi:hypothetical protein
MIPLNSVALQFTLFYSIEAILSRMGVLVDSKIAKM